MNLQQKLTEDMKTAMKGKDMRTLEVVRMTLASVKNKAIELNKELEDAEIIAVIKSDWKKIRDALDSFTANAREDLAEKAREELKVLERYLPAQMSSEELEKIVRAKIQEMQATVEHTGKVVGALAKDLKGQVDGSRIKETVDRILNGK